MAPIAAEAPRLYWDGATLTYLVTGAQTCGAWALLECVAPGGWRGLPGHRHARTEETLFVFEGRLDVTRDGAGQTLGPGDFLALPAGTIHGLGNPGPGPARFRVHLAPGGLEGLFLELIDADPSRHAEIAARYDTQFL